MPVKLVAGNRRRSVGATSSVPGDSPESRKVAHYRQRIKESVEDLDEKEIEFLREKLNIEDVKEEPLMPLLFMHMMDSLFGEFW